MQYKEDFDKSMRSFLSEEVDKLMEDVDTQSPSEYAEATRYLPPSVTSVPGFYSYDVAPYLREIVDCFDVRSPIKEFSMMKGVQIGGTVGVLENGKLYAMGKIKSAPCMLVTADADLAKIRMESYVMPMIHASGLGDIIQSNDEVNTRRTGSTAKKLEWKGGGYLLPFGANNANKMKSFSIQFLFRDEITTFPKNVGGQGSPLKLTFDRTKAYEQTRKVADVSSPSIKGACFIESQFKRGDQRYYYVPCVDCGKHQVLRWSGIDTETGLNYGLDWEYDEDGDLLEGSVRYVCKFCGHRHENSDKVKMLPDAKSGGSAYWKPTAKPAAPHIRSYHISALYSPASFFSWESAVREYLEAFDPKLNKVRDIAKYQAFYNSVLAETFEVMGEKLKFNTVSSHRRKFYNMGEVPNYMAEKYSGGPIGLVVCTVDVHKGNLAVATWGFAPGTRAYLIEYKRLEGNCMSVDDGATWGELANMIEGTEYTADDGKRYRIALTVIDSSYLTDIVNMFCESFDSGVYPLKGRKKSVKGATNREFSMTTTPRGLTAFYVTVDLYKDSWSQALKREWDGVNLQPERFFNAPNDLPDKAIKELSAEYKTEVLSTDGRVMGFEWKRPSGADNELWDLLQYANCALDITALDVCEDLGEKKVNWPMFWGYCLKESAFFS